MANDLSSYILSFLIILSNVVTIIYCYPIFLEFVIIYSKDYLVLNCDVGFYIGVKQHILIIVFIPWIRTC